MNKFEKIMLLLSFLFFMLSSKTFGNDFEVHKQTRKLINDYADSICLEASAGGEYKESEITGTVKIGLPGLFKRLLNLGLDVEDSSKKATYENVLRKDIVIALRDRENCRLKVFLALKDKLIPDYTAPKRTAGSQQGSVESPSTPINPIPLRPFYEYSENFYEVAMNDPGYQVDTLIGSYVHTMTCPSDRAGANEWGGRLFIINAQFSNFMVRVKDPGTKNLANDGVRYRVLGDGKILAEGFPTPDDGMTLSLNVKGIFLLKLESSTGHYDQASANAGRNQNYADEVWWLNPELRR